ncbi:MAG: penicillin-binding protein 2 [Deltaproteobacteria bacterium CG11_big_fil_rev_8_21_14_0_20_49_13]|nr:MAG: penicillin-binding protein 2 [Deltaproteobacteria bacterium CG11_big_fil_rev_8_21_14_0_20_49_13]
MDLTNEYTHDIGSRFKYLIWIIVVFFLIVIGRLYYLQIIKGSYYHFFSEQNSIKDMDIPALRGGIYDKNGIPLVDDRPAFDIIIIPQYVIDKRKTVESISKLLGMDPDEIKAKMAKNRLAPKYFPVVIKDDTGEEDVAAIRAHKTPWHDESDPYDLRGVDIQMRYARIYPDGLASSHLLGYLKEIDTNRLEYYQKEKIGDYRMGDFVGIGGVEEMWDSSIRGRNGYDQKVVNAIGREVIWPDMELIHEEPRNGASLNLTIDSRLQKVAKEELGERSGAVVAIDPRTGGVLALYSSPSIDLNKLSSPDGGKYWQEIASDKKRPLYNRAIQAAYPPGSTYKIVTATASLEEGAIKPTEHLSCAGGMNFGGRFYKCWRKGGHGSIEVKKAITSSCDTFFYQMGLRLGPDKIAKHANDLGFGQITGIDLPGERTGLIPTSKWKMKRFNVPWQAGENLSISVGQGYDTVTPLQNAVMMATIANDGKRVTPHVTDSLIGIDGSIIYKWRNNEGPKVMNDEDLKLIKEGLEGVVDSPEGTAHRLSTLGLKIAGKTGTAQVISKEQWRAGVEELRDHAWFVGYAPYGDPKIAVAVIVEHGGFGASAAAPIVGKVIETYLK